MTGQITGRAVTVLLLALCSLIGSGVLFSSVPATVARSRAIAGARVCPEPVRADEDCLVQETGRLFGPYSTRHDPGDDWVFQPGGSIERERFGLDPLASQRAEYLPDTVTALRWHGETVALETEDASRIWTEDFRGSVANKLYLGLILFGGAAVFLASVFVVHRSPVGWAVRCRDPEALEERTAPVLASGVLAAGGIGMFTIAMGGSTSLSLLLATVAALLSCAAAVRSRRRWRRHP